VACVWVFTLVLLIMSGVAVAVVYFVLPLFYCGSSSWEVWCLVVWTSLWLLKLFG